ncbi:peptide methionine sulfoxide reductase, partial [mine drainage metagenome]
EKNTRHCVNSISIAVYLGGLNMEKGNIETVILGGGCFWCTEAIYLIVKGVINVESGYSGGTTINPSYEEVCSGKTGHAEVIRVTFDSEKISFNENYGNIFFYS